MSSGIHSERDISIQRRTRGELLAPDAAVTKFTIEIQGDTLAHLERVVEDIRDLTSPFFEVLGDTFHYLVCLASEDRKALFEFSTAVLLVNWIFCYALSPFIEAYQSQKSDTDPWLSLLSISLFKLTDFLDNVLAKLGSVNQCQGENVTSVARDEDVGDSGASFFSPLTDVLTLLSPTVVMIVGPLTIIILTSIIADSEYHLFAGMFAPLVDRVLSCARWICVQITPETQYQMTSEDGETYDGVLWGVVMLFCLESVLVGSIIVLMVLISLSLTILTSMSAILSNQDDSEILEESTKIFAGLLLAWTMSVVMTNILRMVLYQAIDNGN